jgi:hypothetical protein
MEIYFLLLDWEGISLVDMEKLRFLVSLAQHTFVSSGSSTAEGCHRIISGFRLFHPCEGTQIQNSSNSHYGFLTASTLLPTGHTVFGVAVLALPQKRTQATSGRIIALDIKPNGHKLAGEKRSQRMNRPYIRYWPGQLPIKVCNAA